MRINQTLIAVFRPIASFLMPEYFSGSLKPVFFTGRVDSGKYNTRKGNSRSRLVSVVETRPLLISGYSH
ncbi:MAG: hypothetical protein IJM09_03170 [Neisseriaceae bacterium]|nr:hypothetical protein [Neisseriaceae bacterium]